MTADLRAAYWSAVHKLWGITPCGDLNHLEEHYWGSTDSAYWRSMRERLRSEPVESVWPDALPQFYELMRSELHGARGGH